MLLVVHAIIRRKICTSASKNGEEKKGVRKTVLVVLQKGVEVSYMAQKKII